MVFIFQYCEIHGQKLSGMFTFHPANNITVEVDSIDSAEYFYSKQLGIEILESHIQMGKINWDSLYKADELKYKRNKIYMDSLFPVIRAKYPKAFSTKDSCLYLNGNDTVAKVCIHHSDDKSSEGYSFEKYENNFLVIQQGGYEWWNFILFNPEKGIIKSIADKPFFINDSIVVSAGNYYSEGEFQLMDVNGTLYFGFDTFNSEMIESFHIKNHFYFSFQPNDDFKAKKIYIQLRFPKLNL